MRFQIFLLFSISDIGEWFAQDMNNVGYTLGELSAEATVVVKDVITKGKVFFLGILLILH
jgi:hypothetical protein